MIWQDNIVSINGIGETRAKKLAKLGIQTVRDLIYYFPRDYKDLSRPRTIASLKVGESVIIEAEIASIATARTRRGFVVTNALVKDESGRLPLVWFNQPYMARALRQGEKYIFYGKVDASRATGVKQLNAPTVERYAKIVPIYPASAGLSSKQWRVILAGVVAEARSMPDHLPESIVEREKLMPLGQSLWQVHEPSSMKLLEEARRRLAFDEMLNLARQFIDFERDIHRRQAPAININEPLLQKFVGALPFKLTDGQRIAGWQIIKKMSSDGNIATPLNCLLNGDVGSGKTVVALLASLGVIKAGYNAVWLAPTEILAQQHYNTVSKLAASLDIEVELVTANTKHQIPSANNQKPSLIVGTHAILHRKDSIGNIGLLVIDEQHRFGVEQRRELLREQGKTGTVPHFLSMTATPIPRTLGMLISGAVTLVTLRDKPKERKPIITRIITSQNRAKAYRSIDAQIKKRRQAFVIVPLINETENGIGRLFGGERKALESEAARLKDGVFAHRKIGVLHGRMKKRDKDKVMADFLDNKYDILVSTSVVEVGVDVPNATVMLIENAESFGLAQLHQFRGRVGRSAHRSYCFLAAGAGVLNNAKTLERLNILAMFNDGFTIAQKDLEQRGPGNLFGLEQSGFTELKLASFADTELIKKAKKVAENLYSGQNNN